MFETQNFVHHYRVSRSPFTIECIFCIVHFCLSFLVQLKSIKKMVYCVHLGHNNLQVYYLVVIMRYYQRYMATITVIIGI